MLIRELLIYILILLFLLVSGLLVLHHYQILK